MIYRSDEKAQGYKALLAVHYMTAITMLSENNQTYKVRI